MTRPRHGRSMRVRRYGTVLLAVGAVLLMIVLLPWPAEAHKVHLFAVPEGAEIAGSAYFSGGGPAAGASVRVYGPDGGLLAQLETDAEGRFRFTAARRQDHRFVLQSADGHRAEFVVFADELPLGLAGRGGGSGPGSLGTWGTETGAASEPAQPEPASVGARTDGAAAVRTDGAATVRTDGAGVAAGSETGPRETAALEARLATLIAREVAPVRAALDRYEQRVRLADILAGIGFIFGLFGVALFLTGRRRGP